jgi:hypothetical protein
MDAVLEKLDEKLREWTPEKADEVRQHLLELIQVADADLLDIMRSRAVEQQVLDLLDSD